MTQRRMPHLATTVALSAIALARCAVTDYEPAPLASYDSPRGIDHKRNADEVAEINDDGTSKHREPPKPAVVDLNQAINEALGTSPAIAALSERVDQAQGDLISASLIPNPIFYMTTSLQPFPGHGFTVKEQGGPTQYDILLQQQLDPLLFGKRSAAVEASKRGVDVARADYADARRQRALATADTFYDVLVAKELVRLTNDAVDQLERTEKLIAGRVASGDTAIIDLDRARLNTRVTRRESREAFVNLAQARTQLQSLMGRRTEDPAFDIRGELETADTPEVPSIEVAMAHADELRPDIESARRAVKEAEAGLTAAKREALPIFTVQVGGTYQFQHPIGFNDARTFGGGFSMSLPTFDRNQGNIAVAESRLRQAKLELDALMVQTRAEIDRVISEYGQQRDSMRIDSAESIAAARDVRDRIEKSYREGGSTLLELLDATRAYQEAIRGRMAILAGFWHARVALDAATGNDFTHGTSEP
jgi:cobalt-zinc-cadmium efflux system outer membrane protein